MMADIILALNSLPESIRGVKDSFGGYTLQPWALWVFIVVPVTLITGLIAWYLLRSLRQGHDTELSSPRQLFEEILEHLVLPGSDKQLLREMVQGARLRHPAMCLLSPGMLDWARRLWIKEAGPNRISSDKYNRIDEIAVKLYDHHIVHQRNDKKAALRTPESAATGP